MDYKGAPITETTSVKIEVGTYWELKVRAAEEQIAVQELLTIIARDFLLNGPNKLTPRLKALVGH